MTRSNPQTVRCVAAFVKLFGVLYPLLYLLSVPRDRQNRFLRFHCFQCLFLFALLLPLLFVIGRA